MLFKHIPQFTHIPNQSFDLDWTDLVFWFDLQRKRGSLDLDPDFQRGHVWTEEQQQKYIEFVLRGGKSNNDLLFNNAHYYKGMQPYCTVLVDGKQRLEAVRKFLYDGLIIFGKYKFADFTDSLPTQCRFRVYVNVLQTRAEILTWYLEMNGGGTVHSAEELGRVAQLLAECER